MIALLLAIPMAAIMAMAATWKSPRRQAWSLACIGSAQLVAALVIVAVRRHAKEPLEHMVGGWKAPIGIALRLDMLSMIMVLLTALVVTASAFYNLDETLKRHEGTENPVYHLSFALLLFALTGIFLTHDLFNFYVFFELVAVSSYLLVSTGKYRPIEAAWKYAIQSTLGSAALLIGIALIYARTGTLNMSELAHQTARLDHAAPLLLSSFLLKSSLFPFHLWQQDAHAAATSPGSAILAGLLIKVGLYGFLRIWPLLFADTHRHWLLAVGSLSIVFGALAAWREQDAKRLLGFSSVSQVGFVLLGAGWGTAGARAAAVFLLVHHSLSKALLFLCTGVLSDARGSARFGSLIGSGRAQPWLQAAFLAGGFSLVGLPPTVGFIGKVALVKAGLALPEAIYVVVVLVGSLMTLAYVLRAHRVLFWEVPTDQQALPSGIGRGSSLAIGALAATVIGGGFASGSLWRLCAAGAAASSLTEVTP